MRWDNSAGGVVAYYPTKVAMHYRSAWLGDRDNFGELSRGCQKLGMVVVARVDPGGWRIRQPMGRYRRLMIHKG